MSEKIGKRASKKNVPIVKNGKEYPNKLFNSEPIMGPNSNPKLKIFCLKTIFVLRSH